MTNVITTTYTKQRFEYEMDIVTSAKARAAAAQKKRLAKRLSELRSVTESEAEAWALELDAAMTPPRVTDPAVASAVSETWARGARWARWCGRETELDGPGYALVMQGLHRLQVRGATAEQEAMYIKAFGF